MIQFNKEIEKQNKKKKDSTSKRKSKEEKTQQQKLEQENQQQAEDYDSSYDGEEVVIKWKQMLDGSDTLDDVIEALEEQKQYLIGLKKEGYEVLKELGDNYGILRKLKKKEIDENNLLKEKMQQLEEKIMEITSKEKKDAQES